MIEACIAHSREYVRKQGVVLEVFSNSGAVNNGVDPQWIEISRITNPRELEYLNSADSSRGQNDFLGRLDYVRFSDYSR